MKKVVYTNLYKLLVSVSGKINNRYINRFKITIGTTLLLLTTGCQTTKKKINNEEKNDTAYTDSIEKKTIRKKKASLVETTPMQEINEDTIKVVTCYYVPPVIEDEIISENDTTIYEITEHMPTFPGGTARLMKYLTLTARYPDNYVKSDEKTRVVIQMIIEKDGSITEPKVVRNLHPELDSIALNTVKALPRFEPARHRGYIMRCKYTVPVIFKLK